MPSPRLPFSPTALPPQARSRSLSPPAQASQCNVRHESSPPHSRNGAAGAFSHRQRSSEVKKHCQVSFSPVLTLYSISGDIHFLKHFSILPGYQAFRHQESSTPIRRRKRSTLSKKPSTTSNKLSTLSYTTGSHSGAPDSTGSSGSPRLSSTKSKKTDQVPSQVTRHSPRESVEDGQYLPEPRKGRQQSRLSHQTKTPSRPQAWGQGVPKETC